MNIGLTEVLFDYFNPKLQKKVYFIIEIVRKMENGLIEAEY